MKNNAGDNVMGKRILPYKIVLPDNQRWIATPWFTKQHYEVMAETLRGIRATMPTMLVVEPVADSIYEMMVAQIGLMFAQDNRQFDSFRFAAACITNTTRGARRGGKKRAAPPLPHGNTKGDENEHFNDGPGY